MTIQERKELFITNARKKWGDKYDYSRVEYVNYHTKVCVICPIHGEFWLTPFEHLGGKGCRKCAKNGKLTTQEFIEKAREIHGSKYDYSKVIYKNATTKVCIICPEHGEFWQLPNAHYRGQGCPMCKGRKSSEEYSKLKEGGKKISENHRATLEYFIKRAKETHGDRYDYSKVNYINATTKVCIICPEHGEFWQLPMSHIQGSNCPICGKITAIQSQQMGTEGFIERARKAHGDKYDYSKTNYIDLEHKVCIICPEHGEFWQSPTHHLYKKQGCPLCNRSVLEENIAKLLSSKEEIFTQEKTFDWLKYEHYLRLDFYLPEYNIAIECQGEQHFKPIDYFGGEEVYEESIHRDLKKIELCNEHGITLLHYATCEVPKDFDLYEVITSEEELIGKIREIISIKQSECIEI